MPLQIQGNGGVTAEVDGTVFRAHRTTARPVDYSTFGSYSYGGFTGILPAALAANSEVFQFRWADASRIAVIHRVLISAVVSTTFFAAGVPVQIDLVKSTAWSVAGTLGTGITPAALLKRRTSMGNTLMVAGDMRIATTAALGAGTKTLETLGLATVAAPGPITASLNGLILPPTLVYEGNAKDGDHPLCLVQNEGFSIRSIAVPATGTWTMAVTMHWSEVSAY